MKKFLKSFLLFSLIFSVIVLPVSASDVTETSVHPSRLIDLQDVLTDAEEESVLSVLDSISEEIESDIVILTTDNLDGYGDEAFCDNYFDYGGYGLGEDRSGILLAINFSESIWYISTRGTAIYVLSDYEIDELFNSITDYLYEENYEQAFITFAQNYNDYNTAYVNGDYSDEYAYGETDVFDDYTDYTPSFTERLAQSGLKNLVISLIFGFIIALIVVSSMKSKLKTVHLQSSASGYERQGSMQLTESRDMFLFHKLTVTPKPQQNSSHGSGGHSSGHSTHTSSSGASHGGHGGRF